MFNITMVSLSVFSVYSLSPLFTHNSLEITKGTFVKSFPRIFFNIRSLFLDQCSFSNLLGPVIDSQNIQRNDISRSIEIKDEQPSSIPQIPSNDRYENINHNWTLPNEPGKVITIINCQFLDIQSSQYMIKSEEVTYYMSNCLIAFCKSNSKILDLKAQYFTMTHICFYQLWCQAPGDDNTKLIEIDLKRSTFMKFLYNSFYDISQNHNWKYGIDLQAGIPLIKCNNFTKFAVKYNVFAYISPFCFSFAMNSLSKVENNPGDIRDMKSGLFYFNFQQRKKKHAFSHCNYINCIGEQGINLFNFNADVETVNFKSCFFDKNVGPLSRRQDISAQITIIFDNCYLNLETGWNVGDVTITNQIESPQLNENAHFNTQYCSAVLRENAYGCADNSCPDIEGCDPNDFSFSSGVVTYTLLPHPDIYTPSPSSTDFFSPSLSFSSSSGFSKSISFTQSNDFSISASFDKSQYFSSSNNFSLSELFSRSLDFDPTSGFSKSISFTQSNDFSISANFSISQYFSSSSKFSISLLFSKSYDFSSSDGFSQSAGFPGTKDFTKSLEFSQSHSFTSSAKFTSTDNFSYSAEFSKSEQFSFSFAFIDVIPSDTIETHPGIIINQDFGTNASSNMNAVIFGIIGGVVGIVLIAIAIMMIMKKKKVVSDYFEESLEQGLGDEGLTYIMTNPINQLVDNSDPFEDDFVDAL